jgi:hypothetical protein
VTINNCRFSDSKIVDDMVHVVYSDVNIKNTTFLRSFSDALDVDISNIIIENSHFIDSGNDAIDLMTSEAVVINSTLEGSGDKGVSTGENSRLLSVNNLIVQNDIGVQSKDGSVAYILNTNFVNNLIPMHAYKKNWRYSDGGKIIASKIKLKGNEQLISVGKRSTIELYDSYTDNKELLDKEIKNIFIDKSVDYVNESLPVNKSSFGFEHNKVFSDYNMNSWWTTAKPSVRGVYDAD